MEDLSMRLYHIIDTQFDGNQKKFAKAIGASHSAITQYVYADRKPSYEKIVAICKTCNVSADWLLGLDTRAEKVVNGCYLTTPQILAPYFKYNEINHDRYIMSTCQCPVDCSYGLVIDKDNFKPSDTGFYHFKCLKCETSGAVYGGKRE